MSVEENKALVRRFMQAYNDREMDIFEELVAEDYIRPRLRSDGP